MPTPERHPANQAGRWAHRRGPCGLILAWLIGISTVIGCQPREAGSTDSIAHTPIPKDEAVLEVGRTESGLRYQGTVADEATRDALVRTLQSVQGLQAEGDVSIDRHTLPPAWSDGLGQVLERMARFKEPGATLGFQGKHIVLSGQISNENRATLLKLLQRLYLGFTFSGLFEGVDMADALPDPGDTAGLVAFLNRVPLVFDEGTGMLSPTSLPHAARAARGIQSAGPGAERLELRIYPDADAGSGDSPVIARQRAEAIATQLALGGVPPSRLVTRVMPADKAKPGAIEFAAAGAMPSPGDVPVDAGAGDAGGNIADADVAAEAPPPKTQDGRGD